MLIVRKSEGKSAFRAYPQFSAPLRFLFTPLSHSNTGGSQILFFQRKNAEEKIRQKYLLTFGAKYCKNNRSCIERFLFYSCKYMAYMRCPAPRRLAHRTGLAAAARDVQRHILIERNAQNFISWFLFCADAHHLVKRSIKSSKSIFAK